VDYFMHQQAELAIVDNGYELVIDSRLIALRLGVEHRSLIRTIERHIGSVQQFGVLRLEIHKLETGTTGRPQRFCYLNENQATLLMSLSKNTEQVVQCKIDLVTAFSKAKTIIKTVIPVQNERIRELELTAKILELENEKIRRSDTMLQLYGAELGLTLLGHGGQMVEIEKVTTEVVNLTNGHTDRILTAEQLKVEVQRKSGQKLKTAKQFTDKLIAAGRDDLLIPVDRKTTGLYVDADRLDEALAVVYGKERQRVITPVQGRLVETL
jgi:phage regulator Rha-like protein